MSEDKLQDAIYRGSRAESLLKDEVYNDSYRIFEEAAMKELLLTRPTETDAREKLYLAINISRKLKDIIGQIAASGRVSKAEMDQLIERQKRVGRPPKAA